MSLNALALLSALQDVGPAGGAGFWVGLFVVLGGILLVAIIPIWLILNHYVKVGPNEALIISGGKRQVPDGRGGQKTVGFRIVKGGRGWPIPFFEKVDVLSLELMTIDVKTENVYSIKGVPVHVEGVAQIKVRGDELSIGVAAERFLSKTPSEIMNVALHTLQGHLRAIIGKMTVEELYRDRDKFAQNVQGESATDFATMGLSIDSFTIREINDQQGYLEALGKPQTAQVKRDAIIGQAEADRDATIKSSEAHQLGQKARFTAEALVAQSQKDFEVSRAKYTAEMNEAKAKADQAYPLQEAVAKQAVKLEEMKILEIEKERMIEIKQRELQAAIQKPADAEKYRIQQIADANKYQIIQDADARALAAQNVGRGEAEAIKARGLAEAEVIMAKGQAEAEAMKKKADAWRSYNEAAIAQMFIEKLPELARAVAEPLGKVDRITVISTGNGADGVGASKVTRDIVDVIAQLPPVLEGVSGINIKELLSKVPGLAGKVDGGKKA